MKVLIEVRKDISYHEYLILDYFQSSDISSQEKKKEEQKHQPKGNTFQQQQQHQQHQHQHRISKKRTNSKEVVDYDWEDEGNDDDIENDIYLDRNMNDDDYKEDQKESKGKEFAEEMDSSLKKYCEVAYLGNGGYSEKNICDNLLCTKCDVKVSIFPNKQWDTSVNYMFFRNNYARKDSLSQKLLNASGQTCYSCQCTWNSIAVDFINASKVSHWICRGHS